MFTAIIEALKGIVEHSVTELNLYEREQERRIKALSDKEFEDFFTALKN